jgi:hypothetical protein
VHHVLPFEEPPVAADQKKKGIPGEFYVLRLKQLRAPALGVTACNPNGPDLQSAEIGDHIHCNYRPLQDRIHCN